MDGRMGGMDKLRVHGYLSVDIGFVFVNFQR